MTRRITKRALVLAPVLLVALFLWNGPAWAFSGFVGFAMSLGNLWLAAWIIGGVAENNPKLLLPVGMATFALGLLLLTGIAFALQMFDVVVFPVTGFVLIGSHLVLVLWEAAGAYGHAREKDRELLKESLNAS